MRFTPAISPAACAVLLCTTLGALAADDAARAQIQAATRDATANLLDEVSRTRLTRSMSVGDYLQRTRAVDEMTKVLQRAQQIGGPRWIDDRTCQVEMQISGETVAAALKRIAKDFPRESPLSVGEVSRAVKDWDERSFAATGAATSRPPLAKTRVRPKMGLLRDPWWNVTEEQREQAVAAAKADAARRSISSLKPIPITPKTDVGDVLAVRDVGDGLQRWFVTQPASRVELLDDLRAEVELVAPPAEAFKTFRGLASRQNEVPVPAPDSKGWEKIRDIFEQQMAAPVGQAVVPVGGAGGGAGAVRAVAGPKGVELPSRAPAWVIRRLEASASGEPASSKLLAARAAETAAEQKIRKEILGLTLKPGMTLGEAAKIDARVALAVDRAVAHARIGKADYHRDGSADVAIYLDLSDLWFELSKLE